VLSDEHLEGLEPSEFSYRGVDIAVDRPHDRKAETATIAVGDRRYEIRRHHDMWMAPNVFNMYSSLAELGRHMADLEVQGLLPPPHEPKRGSRRKKSSGSRR
jgi:hypothetical protein